MSFTALDFLADVQKRLSSRLPHGPNLPGPEFRRVVNFLESRYHVKILLGEKTVGDIFFREVEEPQDRYIRGAFVPADDTANPLPFTVRHDKSYELETEALTGNLLMKCFALMPAGVSFAPPPPPAPEPEATSFIKPGENFDPSSLFPELKEAESGAQAPASTAPQADATVLYDDSGEVVTKPAVSIPSEPFDPAALFGANPSQQAPTESGLPPPPFDPAALFGSNPAQQKTTESGLPPPPFDPAALFGNKPSAPPQDTDKPAELPEAAKAPVEEKLPAAPFDPVAMFGKNPSEEAAPTESGLPPPPFDPAALFGSKPASPEREEKPKASGAASEQPGEKFPPPPFDPVALFGGGKKEEGSA